MLIILFAALLTLTACQTSVLREATRPATPGSAAAPPIQPTAVPAQPPSASRAPTSPAASPVVSGGLPSGSPVSVVGASPSPAGTPAAQTCTYGPTRHVASAQDRAVKEASALVASQRWPGVYWTLNDSGNAPMVFALDEEGRARGSFRVAGAENEDWEAMQLGPGRDGGAALYIGDIGDNDAERKTLTIYRVPEPEPSPPGAKPASGRTPEAEAFKIQYPGGSRDAETLLVHPQTGEILVLTKEHLGRTTVYRAPQPLDPRGTNRLEKVADVEYGVHGGKADLLVDGAVSADARRVVIRSYGSAFEYDVPAGASLASIWQQTPRVSKLDDGPQGESVAYRPDGSALITIGEGSPARMFAVPRTC
ncbi:MAG: hypothetical protein IT429_05750 [Gemmataceae bacterium]|nr:hypothetical protein [Gemmataceae bacterium]